MTEILLTTLLTGLQVAVVLLAVDFASGVLHWLEDSYGEPSWPFLGKRVVVPNIRHHFKPRAFTKSTFWKRNSVTMIMSGSLLVGIILMGWFHWMWLLACTVGAISNEIHCWAHRSPRENGKIITFLQPIRLIQTKKAHAVHHTNPKNQSYCTVGNFLNPVLDATRFFERIEWVILKVTGVKRREDKSVKARRVRIPVCRCMVGEECVNCPREAGKQSVPALR